MIENTSQRPNELHLLGALAGITGYVEGMESAGQRQLVESTDLPTQGSEDPEFQELGFTFGEPYKHDPLFRPATLPEGWKKVALDHAMGSAIVDELGRQRVSVFYKAAYYDRRADMHLTTVYGYLMQLEYEKGSPVLDDSWATPEAVAEAARGMIGREQETVELYRRPKVAAQDPKYAAERLRQCAETIVWAEALIAQVTS
jgi:hypothetical protein